MAKKRILKKYISYFAGELFSEALVISMLFPNVDQASCEKVMTRILDIQDDFIRRVNHPDAKDNKVLVKKYYKALKNDFLTEVNDIVKELGELSKETDEKKD